MNAPATNIISAFFSRTSTYIAVFFALVFAVFAYGIYSQPSIDFTTSPDDLLSVRLVPYLCGAFVLSGAGLMLSAFLRSMLTPSWVLAYLTTSLCFGMLFINGFESYQVLDGGHIGLNNLFQVSILLLGMVAVLGLWFDMRMKFRGLAVFNGAVFIAGSLFILWLYGIGEAGPRELVPALRSYWLPWHVMANFIGYGAFMVAAGGGVLELWRRRADEKQIKTHVPTVEECRNMSLSAVKFGFPIFTLAVILGSLWAYDSWGGYWSWDPKETWALIVWLSYAGYLHASYTTLSRGKVMPIWAISGFFITLFCYLGVNMFLNGLHSYGQLS